MNELPSDLAYFAGFLDAQPLSVREAFRYCLCLMMVEAGKMELIDTIPTDTDPLCVFITLTGEEFSVHRPLLSKNEEQDLRDALRNILEDEDLDS